MYKKNQTLKNLEGFDVNYSPGYFEDADLCFKNWKNEGSVYVHPRSVVIHKEGGTSGTDLSSGMKKFQNINTFLQTKMEKKSFYKKIKMVKILKMSSPEDIRNLYLLLMRKLPKKIEMLDQ